MKLGNKVKCISVDDYWVGREGINIGDIVEIESLSSSALFFIRKGGKNCWVRCDCFQLVEEVTNENPILW